jgi:hypothetical protein
MPVREGQDFSKRESRYFFFGGGGGVRKWDWNQSLAGKVLLISNRFYLQEDLSVHVHEYYRSMVLNVYYCEMCVSPNCVLLNYKIC